MTTARATVAIHPDCAMIGDYADIVFGYTEGHVAVRILEEGGGGVPWKEAYPADPSLASRLRAAATRASDARRALYVVPVTTASRSRAKAEDLLETAVLPIDLDVGDIAAKRAQLVQWLGEPTLAVASGGSTDAGQRKLHLYWRLTEAARGDDLAVVAALRQELARRVGGDGSFARLTQPIRVAGSLHWKTGVPILARVVDRSDRELDLGEAVERTKLAPRTATSGTSSALTPSRGRPPVSELKSRNVRTGGVDGVTRFNAMSSVTGHWLRRVRLGEITLDEAWAAVCDHNAALIAPPWEEPRLRREFDALLRKDQAAHAAREPQPAPFSDDALAAAFVAEHGDDFRHIAFSKRWMRWSSDRWASDDKRAVLQLVRETCRAEAQRADKPSEARRLSSRRAIEAVERIAAADPYVAVGPNSFDMHAMLLNTPDGVVDLETGVVGPHRRDQLLSRIAGAGPGGPRQRWDAFIAEVTGGDTELAAYIKRVAGYCLTGSTREQVFFFLHGAGANGKSVFLNTLVAAMGDYARPVPFETFSSTRTPGHPTELASLLGVRLALVAETDRNRAWAESRIKSIAGGDPISARYMRGDFFEFRPMCKLIVSGNHRPALTSFGEAMRRRLHLVPFDVTIPPERRDRDLEVRLLDELGGVLAWMIEGSAEWRKQGLAAPVKVQAAVDEYFAEEDLVGQWLAERCELAPDLWTQSETLFKDWCAFAEAQGHHQGNLRDLLAELRERNCHPHRTAKARGIKGIALRIRGAGS